jgi:hypothetical protein
MGTPGTYKLFIGFIGGLAYDVGFCGLKCRPKALYLALCLYVLFLNLGFYGVYVMGLMPALTGGSMIKILIIVSAVFMVEGVISTYLANKFYTNRISKLEK